MDQQEQSIKENGFLEKTLNTIIRIGLIIGLVMWCYLILQPFLMIALWGLIIAVTIYPVYRWVKVHLGNRRILAASLVSLLLLLIIIVPFVLLAESLYQGVSSLKGILEGNQFNVSPPPESVKAWPIIGNDVYKLWMSASQNLGSVVMQFTPQIKAFLTWLISVVKDAGIGFLQFIIAIIVSGFFLALSDSGGRFVHELSARLAGKRGSEFAQAAETTLRSVARGILGVAIIQAALAGAGFLVAGVPAAGLWALIALFLCIIQIGVGPVCIGVVIYMFFHASIVTAVVLMIWCILVMLVDNFLKPLLLGRGSSSPMLVIFLGAIGGFLLSGIIGLFVGAVILSLGYNLFQIWLREVNDETG